MNILALQSYFWDQSTVPQELGVNDCVTFTVETVKRGWGRDYTELLGYNDRRTAVKRLRASGGLQEACTHAMGEMHPIDELEPGDVVFFSKPDTVGVLMVGYIAVYVGGKIQRAAIMDGLMGWKTKEGEH